MPSVSTALLLSASHHLLYEMGLQREQSFSNIYFSQKDQQVDGSGSGFGDLVHSLPHLSDLPGAPKGPLILGN